MDPNISHLFTKLINGDRVALGQAMTLVESERDEDRRNGIDLLDLCEKKLRGNDPSIRLAISGSPGVGKSTFIETLGLKAVDQGHKVGVITIDPSSSLSHGSILGDKSRMAGLSTTPSAFIRSSPAGSVLGGMGRRSHEMMTLLAAVGYDLILIETVGVGQSEHTSWQFTDGFVLIVQPGGGDELQGIKRGITELADIVIVNKADGELKGLAMQTRNQYQTALHYFSPLRQGWEPKIVTCSALEGSGIDEVLELIRLYHTIRLKNSNLESERKRQKTSWLSWSLEIAAKQLLMNHPMVRYSLAEAITEIENDNLSIFKSAFEIENMMKALIHSTNPKSGS